ncbi:Transcription termination protein NusB [Streptococcus mitis]|uniref:Transcription termination protein NusB n=1 Tax=Streptococcus mitis TaxID=28037 RepID=A0A150NLJ3_STRMT|nr:Transcription termination protein NusB [Streptococcus mitis]
METACHFAYTHDREDADVQIPVFLLNLVSGVQAQKDELDKQINQHLKSGWTVERLTLVEKTYYAWVSLKSHHLIHLSW